MQHFLLQVYHNYKAMAINFLSINRLLLQVYQNRTVCVRYRTDGLPIH